MTPYEIVIYCLVFIPAGVGGYAVFWAHRVTRKRKYVRPEKRK